MPHTLFPITHDELQKKNLILLVEAVGLSYRKRGSGGYAQTRRFKGPGMHACISGIAAYLDLKDRDPIKARECLVFGIIWTIFLVVFWGAITNWRF